MTRYPNRITCLSPRHHRRALPVAPCRNRSTSRVLSRAADSPPERSQHPHRVDRRRRSRPALHLGGRSPNPGNGPRRHGRDLAQPLPHRGHVLAHTGIHTHRPESPPRRCRPDRGAGERLGRILGHIPKSSALVADVLKNYGYSTAAWGKWHTKRRSSSTGLSTRCAWST